MNYRRRFHVSLISIMHSFYKLVLSPVLHAGAGMAGGACRFQPTCSEYAAIALHEHGLLRGGWMALKRVLRCHPGSAAGFDPVPPKHPFMQSSLSPVTIKEASISHDSRS
jgi:putative membrane protein insertion efficiency factor